MRRALAASLAALVLAPTAAAAADSEYRIPMQTRTISTRLDLKPGERALALYESLIPLGYSMPGAPQVALYLTEPNIPRAEPRQPYNEYTRWIEGPIAIKVRHTASGEEGYFPLAMPVTSKFEYDLGRAAGLPKVLVTGRFEFTPEGARIATQVAGKPAMSVNFRRGSAEAGDELEAFARNRYKLFALLPALRGPDLFYTEFEPEPITPEGGTAPLPAPGIQPEPEPGWVDYAIEPDLDALDDTLPDLFAARGATLADLVEPAGTAPGLFWDLPQILRLRSGDIGDGGGYPDTPPGTATPPPDGPARCPAGRTVRIVVPRRARTAERAQIRLAGQPLRTVKLRGGRVRIDMTGLPPGRRRFTIRLRAGDRTVVLTRRLKTCAAR